MSRIKGLWSQLRALARPATAERALDEELQFHMEQDIRAAMAAGVSEAQARRDAIIRFGSIERFKDEARDARGITPINDLQADLRRAWRQLRASRGFSAAVIVTLGLGVGANTAIFSLVDTILLRPSPFVEPDRLVMLWGTDALAGTQHEPSSWPDIEDFRARSRSLTAIAGIMGRNVTLSFQDGPERVAALGVTSGLVSLLGLQPVAGRLLADHDGKVDPPQTVMLSEAYWRSRFNADPSIVGRVINIDERPVTVIGVVSAEADLGVLQVHQRADYAAHFDGSRIQVWFPLLPNNTDHPRSSHPFLTLARLAPGVSLSAAQRELVSIASDLEATHRENANRSVNLERYDEIVFAPVRAGLFVLLGAVLLLLLVTCANVANLLLARAVARSREVALRLALGATMGRIRRQFLAESLLLVSLGTAAGVVLAFVGLRGLVVIAPADVPRISEATVNATVLLYTSVIAASATIAFGILPAMRTTRADLQASLQVVSVRRMTESVRGRKLRAAFVVAEVALAVTLVNGAGLLVRSFRELQHTGPIGFDVSQVLKAQYQLPTTRYPRDPRRWPDNPRLHGFHARLLESVRALPGVKSAALVAGTPLDPGYTNSFVISGREGSRLPEIQTRFVSAGYLTTVGIPLIEGRDITDSDDAASPAVALINLAGVRTYFPDASPIGQEVRVKGTLRRIVGVIGDERFKGIDAPSPPAVYAPMTQNPLHEVTLLVHGGARPMLLAPAITRALRDIDPQIPLYGVEPLRATLSERISKERFGVALFSSFAVLAIILALVGVHGVLSYTVNQRVPEMGIRVALGASRWSIVRLVLAQGIALTAFGIGAGLIATLAGSRVLSSIVANASTTSAMTLASITAGVLLTATLASLLPAIRATRADPIQALRAD